MKIFFISKKWIIFLVIAMFIILLSLSFSSIIKSKLLTVSACESNIISQKDIASLTKGKEKIAYLTFDDGPTPNVTPKILDILKEENVKASFFVIGKSVDSYPEITKRAYEEGHFIANHSYDHDNNILFKSDESFISEINKTDLAISNAIGVPNYRSHIFRFPTGFISSNHKRDKKRIAKELLPNLDYTYIDWNCLNNDSLKKYSKEQLLKNLKKTSKGKDTLVILMHDTKFVSDSSSVLKESIEYLKSNGYTFKNFYEFITP